MTESHIFFFVFLATIVVTRIFLYFKPTPSPTIHGFRLHHYMYGLAIMAISFFMKSPIAFAIGLGLFLDEVPYLLIGGKTHADNYSKKSLLGVCLLVILVFFFRENILLIF